MSHKKYQDTIDKIESSLKKLILWLDKNGWPGYDPYDILETRFHQFIESKSLVRKIFEKGIYELFPRESRFILGIKRQINAKAMALFSLSYLNLYKIYQDDQYLSKAKACLEWLTNNKSQNYQGACWGYPFNWQSRIFIPKLTPSSVVTSIAIDAFLNAYELLKKPEHIAMVDSSINFFLNDLNLDKIDKDHYCFSYTPLDSFHVHNANLFVADKLISVGNLLRNEEYISIGTKALNYTVAQQNENGSWYYWGKPDTILYSIDNFHTGYVLRSLFNIYQVNKDEELLGIIEKGLHYYMNHLFHHEFIPKLWVECDYPIDIHCCAESILCLTLLNEQYPEILERAIKVARWSIKNMQHESGYFYYRKYSYLNNKVKFINKIPFIRWGQAWMFYALSSLMLKMIENETM